MSDPYISAVADLHKKLVAARVKYYELLDLQEEAGRQSVAVRMSFYVFIILMPLVIWTDNHFLPSEFRHYFVAIWLSLLPFLLIASLVYRRIEAMRETQVNAAWEGKQATKDAMVEFVVGQIEALAAAGGPNVFSLVYRDRRPNDEQYKLTLDQGFEVYKAALGGEVWRSVHNRLVKDNRFKAINDDIHACAGNQGLAMDLLLHITALIVELNLKEGGGSAKDGAVAMAVDHAERKEPAAQAA